MIKVKCADCGKEFEAQRKSAKFCSDNCRVKWNNKLGDLKGKVTTADKIPSPEAENKKETSEFKEKWVTDIEDYCNNEGITPEELILSISKSQKIKKGRKVSKEEESAANGKKMGNVGKSNWFNDYRKSKLGIK